MFVYASAPYYTLARMASTETTYKSPYALVAEGSPSMGHAVTKALQAKGWEVIATATSVETLNLLKQATAGDKKMANSIGAVVLGGHFRDGDLTEVLNGMDTLPLRELGVLAITYADKIPDETYEGLHHINKEQVPDLPELLEQMLAEANGL